jgi:hypothetical protein
MATITRADFAVIWRTTYPSMLARVPGRMVTRKGYMSAFDGLGANFGRPWEIENDRKHWSWFWSYYLGGPDRTRKLTADGAWERIVPLRRRQATTIAGPVSTESEAQVFVYPHAITVIIRVTATGAWPLSSLASALATIRSDKQWSLTTVHSVSSNRSLDGIATDLRDDAAAWLATGSAPEPGPQVVLTVAAPIVGEGDPASFWLTDEAARRCLAGLAVLGPPGPLHEDRLLETNSDTRLGGQMYVVSGGHAVWHPTHFLEDPLCHKLVCLLRNHADLVSHIAALAGIVSWAGDQVGDRLQIPIAAQPLLKNAIARLEQLSEGNREKTYRSGVAKKRIEPLLETARVVLEAL